MFSLEILSRFAGQSVTGYGSHSTASIPALAVTAYAKAEDRVRVLAGGYQVHLSKPVEPAEFLPVVANLAGLGELS